MSGKQIPFWIKAWCILLLATPIIAGGLRSNLPPMVSKLLIAAVFGEMPFYWYLHRISWLAGIYGMYFFVSAYGLMKGRKWAWDIVQVWAVLSILSVLSFLVETVTATTPPKTPPQYDSLAVGIIFRLATIVYLRQPKVRAFFGVRTAPKTATASSALLPAEKYQKLLRRVDRLIAKGDFKKALPICQEIVTGLKARTDLTPEHRQSLGLAYLAQGRVHEKGNQEELAAESYLAAHSLVELPDPALIYLALWLASRKDTSDRAIEVYLGYIKVRGDDVRDVASEPVHVFLEHLCSVSDATSLELCGRSISLNERVLKVRDDLDWSYYYLGLAKLFQANYREAKKHLENACALNASHRKAAYYMHVCQAFLHEEAREIGKALDSLKKAISSNVDMPEAYYHLARILVNQCEALDAEDTPEGSSKILRYAANAIKSGVRAIKLRSDVPDYHYYHGRACSYAGDSQNSAAAYRKAIELKGDIKEYHLHLAVELGRLSLLSEAEQEAGRALSLDSNYADAHRVRGDLRLAAGEFTDAVRFYQSALVADSKNVRARIGLGKGFYFLNNFVEAIKQLGPAGIHNASREAAFVLARCYSLTDQCASAIPLLEELTNRQDASAEAHYYLGCAFANGGNLSSAVLAFGKCLEMAPSHWGAHLQRGHCHFKAGEIDMAREDYTQCSQLRPDDTDTALWVPFCDLHQGNYHAATDRLNALVQSDPTHYQVNRLLGALAEREGDLTRAEKAYLTSIDARPDYPGLHVRLGVMHCKQGRYQDSISHLERAQHLGCDSDSVLYYLGSAKAECEVYASALSLWTELHQRHPEDQRLFLNINRLNYLEGCRLIEAEEYEEAVSMWEEFFKLRPEDTKMKKDLAELYLRAGITQMADKGDPKTASQHLERARTLDTSHPYVPYYLAVTNLMNGNAAQAARTLERLYLNGSPDLKPRVRYHQALALIKMGQYSDAVQILQEVSGHPFHSELELPVEWTLAVAYALGEQWEGALATLKIGSS